MAIVTQKQFQNRQTNPFAINKGGLKLVGIEATNNDENLLTFTAVIAAGGNTVTCTVNSGNAAEFKVIKFFVQDSNGNVAQGFYAGGAVVINTTNISKLPTGEMTDVKIGVYAELLQGNSLSDGSKCTDYYIPVSAGAMVAGANYNTLNLLNSNAGGAQIDIVATYDDTLGAEETTIDVTALAAAGLEVETFLDGVSIDTPTLDDNGEDTHVEAGLLAPGSHTVKVVIISAGALENNFAEITFTV
jgi:hypothetical protein